MVSFNRRHTLYSQEMTKTLFVLALGFCATSAFAQYTSPEATTSVTIAGKHIKIDYHAPQMHGRKIFGGLEPYGKAWRAGANEATALHTDADLQIKTCACPKATTRFSCGWIRSSGSSSSINRPASGAWNTIRLATWAAFPWT